MENSSKFPHNTEMIQARENIENFPKSPHNPEKMSEIFQGLDDLSRPTEIYRIILKYLPYWGSSLS